MYRITIYFLSVFFLFSLSINAQADDLRVMVLSKYHLQQVIIEDERKSIQFKIGIKDRQLMVNGQIKEDFKTENILNHEVDYWSISFSKTFQYPGHLEINVQNNELLVLNILPIEKYIPGVLLAEFAQAPFEALKAQAVLARTLAMKKLAEGTVTRKYHLGDLTDQQAYRGYSPFQLHHQAVQATQGEVLTYQGKLVDVFWHSTCRNLFFTPNQLWKGPDLDYLKSGMRKNQISDHSCSMSSHFQWKRELHLSAFNDLLMKNKKIIPHLFEGDSKIDSLAFAESLGLFPELLRLKINRVYGWNFLKSNDYNVMLNNQNNLAFNGYGLGHNIGLCQCEAAYMAKRGYSYDEIINEYFMDIQIEKNL